MAKLTTIHVCREPSLSTRKPTTLVTLPVVQDLLRVDLLSALHNQILTVTYVTECDRFFRDALICRLRAEGFTRDPEDSTAKAMTVAWQAIIAGHLKDQAAVHRLLNCLWVIAKNDAIDKRRYHQRRQDKAWLNGFRHYSSRTTSPVTTDAEREELRIAIHAAIRNLPMTQRHAIRLAYLDGLSREDIAKRLGTTKSVVDNILYQARRELRKELDHIWQIYH